MSPDIRPPNTFTGYHKSISDTLKDAVTRRGTRRYVICDVSNVSNLAIEKLRAPGTADKNKRKDPKYMFVM